MLEIPDKVVDEMKFLKSKSRSLLEKVRLGDSLSSELVYWIVHTDPRADADLRLSQVVKLWETL